MEQIADGDFARGRRLTGPRTHARDYGPMVLDVAVVDVAGGDACACAGTTIDSTMGFVHLLGSSSVVATPPMVMILSTCLRSGW